MRVTGIMLSVLVAIFIFGCGSKATPGKKADPSKNKTGSEQKENKQADKQRGKPDSPAHGQEQGIPVEVTPLVRGNIASYLLYNSTLETEQTVDVYSQISGLIEKLFVEEGDHVKKNQPLLQLEQKEYVLEEQKAKLQYDKQKSQFSRFLALKDKKLVSQEEFEDARLAMRQAELQWKQAQLNLNYTIVRSPINGVVGERLIRLGDRIQPSTRLFIISDLSEKVVKVYVPQDELPNCYPNQKAEITTDILPGQHFQGRVKRISPIVDPTSGTFKVTVGVADPENRLRPGLFLGIRLIVDEHRNVPLIPKTALIYENERTYFFLVQGDSVKRVRLMKGYEDARKVEVKNPIPDSSLIVVVGQEGLRDGNQITITNRKQYSWQKITPASLSGKGNAGAARKDS